MGDTVKDAFERRQMVRNRFMGPVSAQAWSKGQENYWNLTGDGWAVRVFLNGKEIPDCIAADPDAGTVTIVNGTLKGAVEIRLERDKCSA